MRGDKRPVHRDDSMTRRTIDLAPKQEKSIEVDVTDQRRHYRMRYLPECCPLIYIKALRYVVTEISEEGLRFQSISEREFHLQERVNGNLQFSHGVIMPISGTVLRFSKEGEVVLYLSQGIPYSVILREQRRLCEASENKWAIVAAEQ